MKRGLNRKSATWYTDTAWEICNACNNNPEKIKKMFKSYLIPMRESQIETLKTAINTQYKYNQTFKVA